MNAEERREKRLQLLEDHIAEAMAECERSGELRQAPSYGKPLDLGDGYARTPPELRMGYKVLKDAGVLPPEVQLMREIETLQQSLDAAPDAPDAAARHDRLVGLRLQLALRIERLRSAGTV